MKLALVTWVDAVRTDDEVTASAKVRVTRETVGWLLRRDSEGVVLAMTRDDGATYERGFMIPAEYVRRVRLLT